MLAELPSTGLADVMASLARRHDLESADLTWQETLEPEGTNNSRIAAYQLMVPGVGAHPTLLGSLWFMLPGQDTDVRGIADLRIDFAAIQLDARRVTPAQIDPRLRITPAELVSFFPSAWQAGTALVLTTGERAHEVPPAGAPRLELIYAEPSARVERRPALPKNPSI
jgi:hypothetical protein